MATVGRAALTDPKIEKTNRRSDTGAQALN